MIRYRWIALGLWLAGSVSALPAKHPADSWNALREKNLAMGFSVERVDHTIKACRANGLTIVQAEDLLSPVYLAHDEQLPTDFIFLKIEEGLAKHVPWQEVHREVDKRLACIRQADALARTVELKRCEQHGHLVMHICMALESGVPAEVLEAMFRHKGSARSGRLVHLVEAAETLQLAGVSPRDTQHILLDCMERDLSCTEVERVVRVLQRRLADGVDFDQVHDEIWVQADR